MTKHEKMYLQIENHGKNLIQIFNLQDDPVKLCKRLHRLEVKAHRLSTDYCNGDIEMDGWESATAKIIKSLYKILGMEKCIETGVFVNGDARGYALKLSDDWVTGYRNKGGDIYRDWGGYGILAPDFNGN